MQNVLEKFNIGFFNEIYGADKFKSKEDMFEKIIRERGLKKKEVVYVGDRPIDVDLAREIGCYSVIVSNESSWSYPEHILKANPDFVIEDMSDLGKVIKYLDSF